MAAVIARRAWRANRMLTVLAVLAQLGTGFSTAFGLLATANVFTHLLQQGPTPARLVAALPSVCWVVAAQAAGALLTSVVGALQSALAPPGRTGRGRRALRRDPGGRTWSPSTMPTSPS